MRQLVTGYLRALDSLEVTFCIRDASLNMPVVHQEGGRGMEEEV